jgi:hypothetical protein
MLLWVGVVELVLHPCSSPQQASWTQQQDMQALLQQHAQVTNPTASPAGQQAARLQVVQEANSLTLQAAAQQQQQTPNLRPSPPACRQLQRLVTQQSAHSQRQLLQAGLHQLIQR